MWRAGLGDRVAPLASLQVNIGPLGFAQLPGTYEDQRSQAQGAPHRQRSPVAVQDAQQGSDLLRIGDGGKMTDFGRRKGAVAVFSVKGGSYVPIDERTSDNGVRVRQERLSTCAADFPYVAGCLAVPAQPTYLSCRTGDTGGGPERPPPFGLPGSAVRSGLMCRAHATPAGGRFRPKVSRREGYRADRASRWPRRCRWRHQRLRCSGTDA